MFGVNSGLCLPRRRRAASVARRPRILSDASIRNQSRLIVEGLAVNVFMELDLPKGAHTTESRGKWQGSREKRQRWRRYVLPCTPAAFGLKITQEKATWGPGQQRIPRWPNI